MLLYFRTIVFGICELLMASERFLQQHKIITGLSSVLYSCFNFWIGQNSVTFTTINLMSVCQCVVSVFVCCQCVRVLSLCPCVRVLSVCSCIVSVSVSMSMSMSGCVYFCVCEYVSGVFVHICVCVQNQVNERVNDRMNGRKERLKSGIQTIKTMMTLT